MGGECLRALIFVAINAVQLVSMAQARLGVSLDENERSLHQGLFEGMTYVAFHRLLKSGEWRRCDGGRELTVEGQSVSELSSWWPRGWRRSR